MYRVVLYLCIRFFDVTQKFEIDWEWLIMGGGVQCRGRDAERLPGHCIHGTVEGAMIVRGQVSCIHTECGINLSESF